MNQWFGIESREHLHKSGAYYVKVGRIYYIKAGHIKIYAPVGHKWVTQVWQRLGSTRRIRTLHIYTTQSRIGPDTSEHESNVIWLVTDHKQGSVTSQLHKPSWKSILS